MSRHGERIGRDAVRFTRILPGPIERVFAHLVDDRLRARWFCGGETDRRVGGRIEMVFEHATLSALPDDPPPAKYEQYGETSTSSGEITRYEEPHVFAFLWDEAEGRSEVVFELSEEGDDVRLVLTHTRLKTREDMVGVLGGWHAHLDILEDVLEGRVPEPFWRRFNPLDAEYDAAIED